LAIGCLTITGALYAQGKKGGGNAGNAAKGKEIFDQCSVCHNTETDEIKVGPSLKALYKHDKLKNGKPVNDASVKDFINTGGNGMPAFADLLSEEEKGDLLAYLKTL
jgi:mono/diheme cytochrome c family protein